MKKIFKIMLLLLLLGSCDKKKEIDIEINNYESYVYCIDYKDKEIKKVGINYIISDYNDVFNIYTIYQNRLPIGYYVDVNSNVGLIKSYEYDNDIYYVVDNYVSLTKDINTFVLLLTYSNSLLGYSKSFIIYNNKTFGI